MTYYTIKIADVFGSIRVMTIKATCKREALDSVEITDCEAVVSCMEV